jgi:hypothetical protein
LDGAAYKRPALFTFSASTMDIREALLAEHSKAQATLIAQYIGDDAGRFARLMDLFFESEYRVSQRAAWVMSLVAAQYPGLFKPYLRKAILQLKNPDVHPSVIRNTLRILPDLAVPKSLHGVLMSECFHFIQTPSTPAAIKAFAITVLQKLCDIYPDIKPELQLIIKERWDQESPAFKARGRKSL